MNFSKERLGKNDWPGPGEFYAPAWFAQLLTRLLEFRGGETLYDPCCGSGAMLLQAARCVQGLRLFGQTGDARMRHTCQANLRLHDLWADLGDRAADALTEDLHAGRNSTSFWQIRRSINPIDATETAFGMMRGGGTARRFHPTRILPGCSTWSAIFRSGAARRCFCPTGL